MLKYKSNKKYIPALTGVRALAAYFVYFCHFVFFYPNIFTKNVNYFISELYIGVAMFFVLSGFLIAYQYYDTLKFNFKTYITNRFARIYPMYFIFTSGYFLFQSITQNKFTLPHYKLYLLNITFLRSFFYDFFKLGIGTGWSLTLEEIFYLIAPLLFYLIKKSKIYILFIPLTFFLTGLLLVNLIGVHDYNGFLIDNSFMFNYTIFGRISEFIFGIILALIVKKYSTVLNTKYCTYIGLAFILLGVYLLSSLKDNLITDGFDKFPGKLINTFFIPVFGVLPFYWGLITEKTIVSKILESQLFQLIGKSSYVFYLIHVWFLSLLKNNDSHNHLLEFIFINLISIAFYYFLEEPLNIFFRGKKIKRLLLYKSNKPYAEKIASSDD
ncbi:MULTISPECIES: acyltransferase family protein [Flavobacterium]|uniref:acyltransferase family protein n=1 Tax=Flavobacterium TaxID=237 RepID=UPI001FCA50DF|nr:MULTISPECIES: acyltransferase [Flavobacterium]UOK41247.1 acyltransferase [Flavobacterium enshiense]